MEVDPDTRHEFLRACLLEAGWTTEDNGGQGLTEIWLPPNSRGMGFILVPLPAAKEHSDYEELMRRAEQTISGGRLAEVFWRKTIEAESQ